MRILRRGGERLHHDRLQAWDAELFALSSLETLLLGHNGPQQLDCRRAGQQAKRLTKWRIRARVRGLGVYQSSVPP